MLSTDFGHSPVRLDARLTQRLYVTFITSLQRQHDVSYVMIEKGVTFIVCINLDALETFGMSNVGRRQGCQRLVWFAKHERNST